MLEGFGGSSTGTIRMETGDPVVTAAPGISGVWIWLFGGLLALSSIVVLRRFAMEGVEG